MDDRLTFEWILQLALLLIEFRVGFVVNVVMLPHLLFLIKFYFQSYLPGDR